MAKTEKPPTANEPAVAPNADPKVDLSKSRALYVNFCRVTATPEEMVLDFALETNTAFGGNHVVAAPQRITLSHLTAKRLFDVLRTTVGHYEQSFGNLEIAVEKRVKTPPTCST